MSTSDAEALGSVRVSVEKTGDTEPSGDSDYFGKYRDYWGVPIATGTEQTWDDLVRDFKQYLAETDSKSLAFRSDEGEYRFGDYTHRFMERYCRRQYAEMKAFEEGAQEDYDNLTTVLLTFTASTLASDGTPRPPIDHMVDLLTPWDNIRYELHHSMNADRKKDNYEPIDDWEYLRILEPTTDSGDVMGGYGHVHVAVVVDGDVSADRFKSVIDKHVEKCPTAKASAHGYENVIGVHEGDEIENLGAYLFEYLGKSYEGERKEKYETAFDALLWQTDKRRFQPSDGAQEWMQYDGEEDGEKDWEFLGSIKNEMVERFEESDYDDLREFREHLEDDASSRRRCDKFQAVCPRRGDWGDVMASSSNGDRPPPD